ncbi:HNH endonuclease [Marinospirillum celere]|uniref:HNH endonuclease n=1 Tax=Marinospirillum celere TaxID=1122252 RepID=A0A1I1DZD5_9GAMM|nr:HNH endonuclease [Marinospirillum celere]SFB80167.1 HNH endonuclease [Marinospirillum celere]
MRAALKALYEGREVSIEDALHIRSVTSKSKWANKRFYCPVCGERVKPHAEGKGNYNPAHFEHLKRNPDCPHSDGKEPAVTGRKPELLDIDDPEAIEGYEQDRSNTFKSRNAGIAKQRKELDKFTCQACGFHMMLSGKAVIECHHLNPVHQAGVVKVGLSDLISLCPTCHRIAHTRVPEPLSVEEIKLARKKAL